MLESSLTALSLCYSRLTNGRFEAACNRFLTEADNRLYAYKSEVVFKARRENKGLCSSPQPSAKSRDFCTPALEETRQATIQVVTYGCAPMQTLPSSLNGLPVAGNDLFSSRLPSIVIHQ